MKKRLQYLRDRIIFNISSKWYTKLALKRAVKSAKKEWLKSGKQQFVIHNNNEYFVVNKSVIDKLNKGKYKKNKITHRKLMDISVYVTPASSYINI